MLPNDETNPAAEMSTPPNLNKDAGAPLQNPLHDMYREHLTAKQPSAAVSMSMQGQPPAPQTPGFSGAQATAPLPQQQAPTQTIDNAADESIWMQRVKDVVEQTQNDPYRKLQMIQQLQTQYQSEHLKRGPEEA